MVSIEYRVFSTSASVSGVWPEWGSVYESSDALYQGPHGVLLTSSSLDETGVRHILVYQVGFSNLKNQLRYH
jgi:hypothetical protein